MDGTIVLDVSTLKALRKQKGLSQEAMASDCLSQGCHVSVATIKRAESGKAILYRTATFIAQYFDVELSSICNLNNLGENSFSSFPSYSKTVVGRSRELTQLEQAIEHCTADNRGTIFYIRGVAGIGKSRLINECLGIANSKHLNTLKVSLSSDVEGAWNVPIQSLIHQLALLSGFNQPLNQPDDVVSFSQHFKLPPAECAHLLSILGLVPESSNYPEYSALSYSQRNEGENNVLVKLLGAVSQPLVIAFEDIHHASDPLLVTLKYLSASIVNIPVFLILSSRLENDPIDAIWRSSILNTPFVTLDLSPLSDEDARNFASSYEHIDQQYRDQCIQLAGGNPLFLEQLLLNFPLNMGAFPSSLGSLIQSKLLCIDQPSQNTIFVASIIGDVFSLAPIQFVLDQEDVDVTHLVRNYLVRPVGNERFQFCHALIRQGIYETIDGDLKAQWHSRLALWYKEMDQALYAKHLCRSRNNRAPLAFMEAAEEFILKFNYADALTLVDNALALSPIDEQRCSLLSLKGLLLKSVELPEKSIQYFQQALEFSQNAEQHISVQIELAAAYASINRLEEAEETIDRVQQAINDAEFRDITLSPELILRYSAYQKIQADGLDAEFASTKSESLLGWAHDGEQVPHPIDISQVLPPNAIHQRNQPSQPDVKVGILHSQTGFMKELEAGVIQATLLALSEVNNNGGLLGRNIQPVMANGQSFDEGFRQQAEKLVSDPEIVSIFGCSTSSSRRLVKPLIESSRQLLIYPFQYEGIEQSESIAYVGPAPNQQALPAVEWLYSQGHRRFLLVGSDYVYPRVTNRLIREKLDSHLATVLDEIYIPLSSTSCDAIAERIKALKPDAVISTLVGFQSNYHFLKTIHDHGISTTDSAILSLVLSENDLAAIPSKLVEGVYSVFSYFQNIDDPINEEFVRRFKSVFGAQQRIGGYMESAYTGVHLWAKAVQKAGSFVPERIAKAMKGISHYAPGGMVYFDEENNHVWRHIRVAQVGSDGEFHELWHSDTPVKPEPYPLSDRKIDWDEYLDSTRKELGGKWENIHA